MENLTHWGGVKHISVGKLTIIGSDNGLSPGQRQAIIWTNDGILVTGPPVPNFTETSIKIHIFSFKKMHLNMLSGNCWLSCLSLYVLLIPVGHSHLPPTAPPRGPRPLTCGVSSECSGTRSYETTSRDQCGKIEMFFSSTDACTATKSPIVNHRSSIIAQLYFASVTQMFMMPSFVKVESDSSKLLRTVSKSGPNGCKERSRPQKMLMRIKIESFLGRQNLVLTVTHSH